MFLNLVWRQMLGTIQYQYHMTCFGICTLKILDYRGKHGKVHFLSSNISYAFKDYIQVAVVLLSTCISEGNVSKVQENSNVHNDIIRKIRRYKAVKAKTVYLKITIAYIQDALIYSTLLSRELLTFAMCNAFLRSNFPKCKKK